MGFCRIWYQYPLILVVSLFAPFENVLDLVQSNILHLRLWITSYHLYCFSGSLPRSLIAIISVNYQFQNLAGEISLIKVAPACLPLVLPLFYYKIYCA